MLWIQPVIFLASPFIALFSVSRIRLFSFVVLCILFDLISFPEETHAVSILILFLTWEQASSTLRSNPYLKLIFIQCNLASARNFKVAFFWNVCCQPHLMKFVLHDNTHFKRKRSHNSARSLNCTEWKSAFRALCGILYYICYGVVLYTVLFFPDRPCKYNRTYIYWEI